jgi:signal peptidase
MSRLTQRSTLRRVGGVLLIAAIIPFVIFAVPAVAGADASYVVLSDSMSPTINAGDAVIVSETDSESIETGDIITFDATNPEEYQSGSGADTALVTHRVIDVNRAGDGVEFTTQGDANSAPDSAPVSGDQVIGVVSFHIPYIGYAVSFAGSQTGMILFVVIPSFLLIVNEVYELLSADAEDEPNQQSAD